MDVKVGDKVIASSVGLGRVDQVVTVERVTDNGIFTNKGSYTKSGALVGASGFDKPHIRTATTEELYACELQAVRRRIIFKIKSEDWAKVSDRALGAIRTILENPNAFDNN